MTEFLQAIVAFPTILFTIPVGLSVLYWFFVVLGAVDIDLIHIDGLEGAAEALDGAMDAGAEAIDGALDAGAEAAEAIDSGLDVAEGAAHSVTGPLKALLGMMNALNLTSVPLTVSFSFMALFGWALSYAGMAYAAPALSLSPVVLASLVAVSAFVVGTGITSVVVKPLAPLFKTDLARDNCSLIGLTAEITTGRVDGGFGQAEVSDSGDHMLIQVRCDHASGLSKGDHALIIGFDRKREAFVVERLSAMNLTSAQEEVDALERAAQPVRQPQKG
ncbi:MAG: YqiJ family protein [Proteobacteria bacterium]|nr:YqiJ family protein [Pseudomonadota bacterium]